MESFTSENVAPERYKFDPDYTLVSKSDLAAVLTVYEAHTPEDVRPFCPWYLRCKEALA
jgi:hypothetical protein